MSEPTDKPLSARAKRKQARVRARDARRKAADMHRVWSPRHWPRASLVLLGVLATSYMGHLDATWPATTKAASTGMQLASAFLPLDCDDAANAAAAECTAVAAGSTR